MGELPPDLSMVMEPPPPDLAQGPDLATCAEGKEICDNRCDDDRDGFADGEDPDCTGGQVLVTMALTISMPLTRLVFWPMPKLLILDGNPLQKATMSTFDRTFSPTVYLGIEGGGQQLQRLAFDGGVVSNAVGFRVRDVCTFNGELLVVEPPARMPADSIIHRFQTDAKTELTPPLHLAGTASACTSDGTNLYVSRFDGVSPSEIVVITAAEVKAGQLAMPATTIPLPAGVQGACKAGCDRLIDFAYIPQSGLFLGLFAYGEFGNLTDEALDSQTVTMFALDGGVAPFLDFGSYHGVGEFNP